MAVEKNVVGGWRSQDFGLQPGKAIEYRVTEFTKDGGNRWLMFELFKPFQSKRQEDLGAWKKGFNFPMSAVVEIVERLNHLVMNYGDKNGTFVFQPAVPQQQMVPQGYAPAQSTGAPRQPGYVGAGAPQPPQGDVQSQGAQGVPQPAAPVQQGFNTNTDPFG